ncbi:MAG: flagellar hook-associated protein FlgK [Planctomycetales bacterium]|nr:flagellar hook-associated protein FlgK [Planctomycetales bacterium]
MLHQLSIGLSGMRAAQVGLQVTGSNLANANTPGYRRQTPIFAARDASTVRQLELGNGVDVQRVRQARALLVGSQLLANNGDIAKVQAEYDVTSQIEGRLNPTTGSIAEQFDSFQSAIEALAASPHDAALRRTTVQSGLSLTRQLNRTAADLVGMNQTLQARTADAVDQVNTLAEQIASLNAQIQAKQHSPQAPNTLIDQRNRLVDDLSQLIDVQLDENNNQVFIAGGGAVIGTRPPVKLGYNGQDVVIADTDIALSPGGQIGGLLSATKQIIPEAQERLDRLATGLSLTFDQLHAQSVGLDGSLQTARSTRSLANPNPPLGAFSSPFPLAAGNLYVGITNNTTGQRTLHSVAFDPATDSLNDLAANLDAVPGLQGDVDDAGRLVLRADSGYGFDFTGRPSTNPDASGLTGTATPSLNGRYEGPNRNVQFEFLGSGDIGVTDGLQVKVTDSSTGESLGVFDIGQGYAPGDEIELPDGVRLQLSVGSVVSGETFNADLVSEGDETGVLTRLGINTLFTGTTAANLTIHPDLVDNPSQLASSSTGEPGDTGSLVAMLQRRSAPAFETGPETIDDLIYNATGAIGHETYSLETELEGLSLVGEQLFAERESVEGVDPNEELVEMLKYQRSFEASARFVTVVNQTLEELMNII